MSGIAFGVQAAYAQEAAEPQRVEVTGSRIRQVDTETAQPILKVTQEQIQATGLITVGDVLNQLSAVGPPSFSKGATLTSNREQGGQYINLRNLGAQRLLVLVDGKRWSQSVAGYTDMSTIPSALIDHIEVLKDGASAIYGSDAIAGVVNVVLKKSLVGGTLSAYKGANSKGDGKSSDYSLTYGAGTDKASLMFGLSHTESGVVWANARDITSYSNGPNHPEVGLGVGQFGRIRNVAANGTATGIDQYLNHTGTWQNPAGNVGSDARNPANYHPYAGGASSNDKFNSSSQMMFESPNALTTLFTKGNIELPLGMRFNTTAMFSERSATAQNAGYPVNSLTQLKSPVYIDKDSYYNPYGNQVAGAGKGVDLFFYRRLVEVPRVTENKNQTVHIDAALEGDFMFNGLGWNWSLGVNHSAVTGSIRNTGNLNLLALKKAVGPSFMNASGVVQCGTPSAPISLAECTPFNILGGPTASTPAALAYIMSVGQSTFGSTVDTATADISGELLRLPAGALGVAAGVERRTVRGYDTPGQFEQSGYSTDLAANSTFGRYTVKEAYLEANIPLLKDKPFAKELSVDLASRYSDYSNFGTTTNSKASFMWKPISDLLGRGTWAQGFRAPSLGDTFGGGSQSYDSYLDICDSQYGQRSNPTVDKNCAAAGVPAKYRQLNSAGSAVSGTGGQSPVPFSSGVGNSALTPETATTKTLGLVYSPSFIPGLSGSLDWFNIKVNNRITAVSVAYTLNQCYLNSVQDFCNNIKRDTSGAIVGLSRGNQNLGQLSTEGFDIGLKYKLPATRWGTFGLRSDSTLLRSYKIKSTATANWQEYTGEFGYNRLKSNLSLDWGLGPWSSTYTMRYASAIKDQCWSSTVECSNPNGQASFGAYNKLGATTYSDLNVAYATPWKGKIMLGVNNLFNKAPRVTYNVSTLSLSSSSVVDPNQPIDRFFYVRYNQSF